ncbi:aldose 1-epimerase family protein [Jatrophihabitans sp.]|uniref:aldose 1-epimerase family protein n=1 Tax=Jatrophihabitans sp. TaxID=1932789 RepID=UPI0030C7570E|nr:Aldose 1-epimerase [Jatrophihabitans sp.]
MGLSGREFVISAGEHTATVVEVGAGLRSYRHAGTDLTATYPDDALPPKCCGAVLVPWPNRLRAGRYTFDGRPLQLALTEPAAGNAIHGLGRWARWRAMKHEPDAVTLRLDIVPQTGWPFELRVDIRYALDADRGLSVTTTATNRGEHRAPFGAGFHPYLTTHGAELDHVTVRIPARRRLVLDDAQVPVGEQNVSGTPYDLRRGKRLKDLRMDDGFTGLVTEEGRGFAEVRSKHGGARVWFDQTFGYLQVFTVPELTPGTPAVAIEPMTCAPDAFNSGAGLILLDPRQSWSGSWGIQPLT